MVPWVRSAAFSENKCCESGHDVVEYKFFDQKEVDEEEAYLLVDFSMCEAH